MLDQQRIFEDWWNLSDHRTNICKIFLAARRLFHPSTFFVLFIFFLFLFFFFIFELHNPWRCRSGCRWKPELQHAIRHWDRFACKRRQVRRQYVHGLMYQGGDARSRVINKSLGRRLTPLFLVEIVGLDHLLYLLSSTNLQNERSCHSWRPCHSWRSNPLLNPFCCLHYSDVNNPQNCFLRYFYR